MVDAAREPLAMTGHVVIQPRANPHRTLRLVTDIELLLAATIASVRMNRPAIVIEPPVALAACDRCHEAYEEARRIIEGAGGIAKWMEVVTS
jgi:hypothetical protein